MLFNVSIRLYEDDPVDAEIIEWLGTLPVRQEQGSKRTRNYRRGIVREVRLALYEHAKKQKARRASSRKPASSLSTQDVGVPVSSSPAPQASAPVSRGPAENVGVPSTPKVRF